MKKLLLLGGTADARHITKALLEMSCVPTRSLQIVYSVAGLVRTPKLPCEVLIGGFSQFGGLATYIRDQKIDAILDVTHPFAATMSSTTVSVAKDLGIPCWRFHRPEWQKQPADKWRLFDDWQTLIPTLAAKQSVLLTAGQLTQDAMDQLVTQANEGQRLILRTAAPPRVELPDSVEWIKGIGPFRLESERALFQHYGVDALVTKNSGGVSTEAKLHAARELGVEVFMLQRPELPDADQQFSDIAEGVAVIRDWMKNA
ncbi:precorrin-6A/cobalt-precorrin-6A reductase [Pontibacterium granulatum]|uniref:precorrin-6A/cobalt-precorrin-6A reductase n=1 Tax=Pontibacterium granulatum TaxID=2036029 RepID=UPI00249A5A20|nr:precorrin-6A/cobalt-precorrin-6A reductase [Pontibacterium granulatum]MDI3323975.1 precorrin-6A/cobalt-precorrin-6A reductase [Pontibacterium granulatum]